jgi:hypothetical protein
VQTADFCGGDLDGPAATAVAEVIHDMAPGADLLLACVDTVAALAQAESWAEQRGCEAPPKRRQIGAKPARTETAQPGESVARGCR